MGRRIWEVGREWGSWTYSLAHRAASSIDDSVMQYEKVAYSYAEEAAYLTILYLALFAGIVWFLMRYANRSLFKWHTWINIFVSYFSSIGILILIPLDLLVVKLTRQVSSQGSYDELGLYSQNLYNIYGALFWPTQIFANVLLVFFEEYNESGYFTVGQRVWDATVANLKFLGVALVAGLIFLAVLVGGGYATSQDALMVTIVGLSNTYGLVVIVFLLGYGIVELPKQMWMDGNLQGKLRRLRGRAAMEFRHLVDASCDMQEIVSHALKTKAEVERLKDPELLKYLPKITRECPPDARVMSTGTVQKDKKGNITRHTLANLRKELKLRKSKLAICEGRVERLKRQVFELEDVVAAKSRPDKVSRIKYASGVESSVTKFVLECYVKPIMRRILSLIVIGMCLSVLFSEVGLMAGNDSAVAVLSRAVHNPDIVPGGLVVLMLWYIAFIAYVMVFALSQLRVADLMEIVPEQRTTPRSMSFNARLCCKLAPPLAYNFLTLCFESGVETGPWMNSKVTGQPVNTAFSRFYGSMDVIPVLGKNFNLVVPIFIIVLAVLQGLNVFNRILMSLHLGFLQFGDPPISKKDLDEGLKKLQKYRQQMEAQMQRESRMRNIRGSGAAALKVSPVNSEASGGDVDVAVGSIGSDLMGTDPAIDELANKWVSAAPPKTREGWMEKKTGHEKAGGGWQNRYFVIKETGVLVQYKKQDKAGATLGTLDLSRVLGVTHHYGKDGRPDLTRLSLDTPEGTMKLRCSSEESAREWKQSLSEWRDYLSAQRASGAGTYGKDSLMGEPTAAGAGSYTSEVLPSSSSSSTPPVGSMGSWVSSMMKRGADALRKGDEPLLGGGGGLTRGSKKSAAMPRPLQGSLQMGSGLFGAYAERNFVVKTTDSSLKYYKAGESSTPLGSIDMRQVERVEFEEKNGKRDPIKFNILLQGTKDVVKLKAETPQEAERWINGLNEWANYFKAQDAASAASRKNRLI